ncbi:MAG: hypothetical protein HOQ41_18345 [Ensifer adhaerens]|nr:hypothetical protein [Ensifer adhaerens]
MRNPEPAQAFHRSRFRFGNGPVICNDTIYLEIVANRRIVFSYTMTVAGRLISASLGTLEFAADGEGTRVNHTEQAAFLDRLDEPGEREVGFRALFQALAAEVERAPADA